MSDLDAKIAELEAQLAALRAQSAAQPATRQEQQASDRSSIDSSPQTSAGGDVHDNALGSGNAVLRNITIAEGGTLVVGAPPADLPQRPDEIQRALAAYLRTLLER